MIVSASACWGRGAAIAGAAASTTPRGNLSGRVERAGRGWVIGGVTEQFGPEPHLALDCPSVWVEQQLGRVVTQAARRIVGPGHPETVEQPQSYPRQEAVKDVAVALRHYQPFLGASASNRQKGHLMATRRHREVRAVRGGAGAQGSGAAGNNVAAQPISPPGTSRWMTSDTDG
jgi:hypothetical protein